VTGQSTNFAAGHDTGQFWSGHYGEQRDGDECHELTANISIDTAAATGPRTVTTTTGTEVASLTNGFTVNAAQRSC